MLVEDGAVWKDVAAPRPLPQLKGGSTGLQGARSWRVLDSELEWVVLGCSCRGHVLRYLPGHFRGLSVGQGAGGGCPGRHAPRCRKPDGSTLFHDLVFLPDDFFDVGVQVDGEREEDLQICNIA